MISSRAKTGEVAIQAFTQLRHQAPNAHLVFIGEGDELPDVPAQVRDAITVTGFIPEAWRAFNGLDLLLHTGNVESFGMVILEAMAAKLPVVAAGDGPEFVMGDTGYLPSTDSPDGYAEALLAAHQAIVAGTYPADAARQRVEDRFSTEALSHALQGLVAYAKEPDSDPYAPVL